MLFTEMIRDGDSHWIFRGKRINLVQNFTTFASPHLGVRTPLRGYHNHVWNILGARTLSMSGRQLFTIDKFRQTGRPLLAILADEDSIFIRGLAKFKRRTLYANIVNDRSAVYYTTGISSKDPFTDLTKIKINYLEGYDDVIINGEDPILPADPQDSELPTVVSRLAYNSKTMISRLPLVLAMVVFIPIGVVAFLLNSGFQSFRSSRRIRLHEEGKAGIEVSNYRMPLLINGMREVVEDVYENLNSAQGHEYLGMGSEEEALGNDAPISPRRGRPESPVETRSFASESLPKAADEEHNSSNASISSFDDALKNSSNASSQVPTLALAPYQFTMIQTLDRVGFRKYPVHIHKVAHSHAAIIVRMDKPRFSEGKIVIRHWLDEEFLL